MFQNNISQASIVANFRKNAKALIQIHDAFFQMGMTEEQYSGAYLKYFESFRTELKTLYDSAVTSGAYFAEGLRGAIKADLDKSFENYLTYYEKRFSQPPARASQTDKI
jgi:hypothetical protein